MGPNVDVNLNENGPSGLSFPFVVDLKPSCGRIRVEVHMATNPFPCTRPVTAGLLLAALVNSVHAEAGLSNELKTLANVLFHPLAALDSLHSIKTEAPYLVAQKKVRALAGIRWSGDLHEKAGSPLLKHYGQLAVELGRLDAIELYRPGIVDGVLVGGGAATLGRNPSLLSVIVAAGAIARVSQVNSDAEREVLAILGRIKETNAEIEPIREHIAKLIASTASMELSNAIGIGYDGHWWSGSGHDLVYVSNNSTNALRDMILSVTLHLDGKIHTFHAYVEDWAPEQRRAAFLGRDASKMGPPGRIEVSAFGPSGSVPATSYSYGPDEIAADYAKYADESGFRFKQATVFPGNRSSQIQRSIELRIEGHLGKHQVCVRLHGPVTPSTKCWDVRTWSPEGTLRLTDPEWRFPPQLIEVFFLHPGSTWRTKFGPFKFALRDD
jgi:hypothetical protein